jgi:hypothetical protein
MLEEDEVDNSAVTLTQSTAKRGYIPSGIAAAVVIASSAVVAALGILVTAGGRDQRFFHLPSVMYLREKAPNIDIVNMPTATGPLYHLLVAAVSGPLHLGAVGTQIVGSFFAAALAALAVWHTRTVPHAYGRVLAAAPLLLSPYFWESSLWMLTDDAAILFALAALITLMSGMTTRNQLTTGLLVAGAIATRQNFVWLLAPACATYLYELRFHPVPVRAAAIARVSAPGAITLAVLVSLWKGLTPTLGKGNAATQSLTSVSFAFAVAAIFAIPILLATLTKPHVRGRIPVDVRGRIPVAVTVGMAAAMPAVIFTSSATTKPDDSRRGGVIWSAVSVFPDVANRSPLLAALAFVGGFASTILYFMLTRRIAILLATSLMSVAIVTSAGAQLYQKYVELPIGILTLIALVYLFQSGRIVRKWPLLSLALFQATMTAGIVGLPILRALQS